MLRVEVGQGGVVYQQHSICREIFGQLFHTVTQHHRGHLASASGGQAAGGSQGNVADVRDLSLEVLDDYVDVLVHGYPLRPSPTP